MGKKKGGGRTTPKTCKTRSGHLQAQAPHKFTSSINEQFVCSWCGKPKTGTWPTHGLAKTAPRVERRPVGKMFT